MESGDCGQKVCSGNIFDRCVTVKEKVTKPFLNLTNCVFPINYHRKLVGDNKSSQSCAKKLNPTLPLMLSGKCPHLLKFVTFGYLIVVPKTKP